MGVCSRRSKLGIWVDLSVFLSFTFGRLHCDDIWIKIRGVHLSRNFYTEVGRAA
jgi:hypothetical protein